MAGNPGEPRLWRPLVASVGRSLVSSYEGGEKFSSCSSLGDCFGLQGMTCLLPLSVLRTHSNLVSCMAGVDMC